MTTHHIRPSVSGNFRPVDHAIAPVKPTDPADLAAAARYVHRIAERIGDVDGVPEVLTALGLHPTTRRAWACAGCDRPMVRANASRRPEGHVHHHARGKCRACDTREKA